MDPRLARMVVPLFRSMVGGRAAVLPKRSNLSLWMKHPEIRGRLDEFNFRCFSGTNRSSASQSENKEAGAGEPAQGAEAGTEVEKNLRAELDKTVSENATLLSKSREFEDKYKRALAETENLRARLTKQINDAKLYAVQGFCKDMTEISDILRMAIDSVPKDQLSSDGHLKNLYDGLAMTDSRLMQVFKSHGLTQINPLDEKFNPNEHEAVVHQPMDGKDSGTVIFVSKVGYKLHERVVRPAVVGVAK